MKRNSFVLIVVMALLSLCFIACESGGGDILKGTWKSEGWNSSAAELGEMIYVFDGKGNYTFTSNMDGDRRTTKGTYTIENGNIVRTFYTRYNLEGEAIGDGSDVLLLDAKSSPMTLTAGLYTADGTKLGELLFVKQ